MTEARIEPSWDSFRKCARSLLRQGVHPSGVSWHEEDATDPQLTLLEQGREGADSHGPRADPAAAHVPRSFLTLGEAVACHRNASPWPLLYRLLWRLTRDEPELLRDVADPDVARFISMHRAVRRDVHKMKAFVRFRSVAGPEGERYVAWFEPRHRIVRRTAPFFARRFPSMRWSLLTPDACAHWDGSALRYDVGAPRAEPVEGDPAEALWRAYYTHTFNPARLRVSAMRSEMPARYWRHLPEAETIPGLIMSAPSRVQAMIDRTAAREIGPSGPNGPRSEVAGAGRSGPGSRRVDRHHEPPSRVQPVRVPRFRVGVAGWDYPDWAGRVYPAGRSAADRLRWVSARFDLIEVNSTFYRPAAAKATRRWIERTADRKDFLFTAKLLRSFTHERGPWREADVAAVRKGMEPLMDARRLSSILVQFPWSFRCGPAEKRHLRRILDAFSGFPLHVEVRHASWDSDAFRGWLRDRNVGLVAIDQPLFEGSLPPTSVATSRVAYLRLHGRNHENWFRRDATRDERYDYDYSPAELEPWVGRARELAARRDVEEVQIVFNNHYRAQAVQNAELFARMLAGSLDEAAMPPGAMETQDL